MSKHLIHPPVTTTSFTFHEGCGKPHEYDGEHGIDCEPCATFVATMSPDERIGHQHLRGPAPVQGATPAEREAFAKVFLAERDAASWRLLPADEPAEPPVEPDAALAAENEALKARIAELEGAGKSSGAGRGKTGKA